ncbi:unnamed protein product [Lathyrus sativus]|nr:unnamed protein product [Lathyrus sativus]
MSSHNFQTLLFFCLVSFIVSLSHALNNGFSVELIHRDSEKSPFLPTCQKPIPTDNQNIRMAIVLSHYHGRNRFLTAKLQNIIQQLLVAGGNNSIEPQASAGKSNKRAHRIHKYQNFCIKIKECVKTPNATATRLYNNSQSLGHLSMIIPQKAHGRPNLHLFQ